jgi:hypothetical protein
MKKTDENKLPFVSRFLIYQKERFPFIAHGLMISAFTFSAVSYSRICRGESGFISWLDLIIGIFATITLFFLVRIFDEFKDQADDAKYRKYLPVPRGLISLKELKIIGLIVAVIQVSTIAIFQTEMLYLYLLVLVYLMLMGVEFFVPEWLKKRHLIYITSHMVIIPLIDIYSSGLDWLLGGSEPHWGLAWFFGVSYMNGLVLEFGRKIRTPETEEEGVTSYTGLYGPKGGVIAWLLLIFLTMALAMGASYYANFHWIAYAILGFFFIICSLPGWLFLSKITLKRSKYIEYASAAWTALMYLSLGGVPMLIALLS